jgi:hypothetical protein
VVIGCIMLSWYLIVKELMFNHKLLSNLTTQYGQAARNSR